jgi:hypothetical protein
VVPDAEPLDPVCRDYGKKAGMIPAGLGKSWNGMIFWVLKIRGFADFVGILRDASQN